MKTAIQNPAAGLKAAAYPRRMHVRRIPVALVLAILAGACTSTTSSRPVPAEAAPSVAPPSFAHFKILQVNDVYKIEGLEGGNAGGLARVRTMRRYLESDGSDVLVLHAGDLIYPSVMSKYLEGRPMIDVLNLLDGDEAKHDDRLIVGFGNHEFDSREPKVLLARLEQSQFEWVSTNAHWCQPVCDQRFPKTAEVVVRDVGGTRVGVIGLLYPLKKSYVETTDVAAAASEGVRAARAQGAQVIIAITHEDMADDAALLRTVPGIDVVIGGHDHLFLQQEVNGKWITKADADAKSVIVYDIRKDAGGLHTTPLRVVMDQTVAKDPQVDARVQQWLRELGTTLGGNEPIGVTKNLLEGVEPAVRGYETALGNLLTDAMRQQMRTDIAILNGGSIRINDNIPPGPITRYDMEGVFYYTNSLVAFRATGQQILDLLMNSVSRADAGDGRFLQVSGMSYVYSKQGDRFVVDPADVRIGGKPLDLAASYSVATIDFVYLHGTEDGYLLFSDATRPAKINVEREADFRKTVEAYIRAAGTVDTRVEGRINRK
jgi:2',3'-cyclic-nucleotide 2'-phosphodiesterase (5'-nucleotidase family)